MNRRGFAPDEPGWLGRLLVASAALALAGACVRPHDGPVNRPGANGGAGGVAQPDAPAGGPGGIAVFDAGADRPLTTVDAGRPLTTLDAGADGVAAIDVAVAPPIGCSSGMRLCSGACAPEAENCGACGHSCRGTSCLGGRCEMIRVASGLGGNLAFSGPAFDGIDLFFGDRDAHHLMAISKLGGPPRVVAATTGYVDAIAVIGDRVYWSESSGGDASILRVAASGGAPEMVATRTSPRSPKAYALSELAGFVYWYLADGDAFSIERVVPGGKVQTVATGTETQAYRYMLVDPTGVYWVKGDPIYEILRTPPTGGAPASFYRTDGQSEWMGVGLLLAADDRFVYWSVADRSIMRMPKDGSAAASAITLPQSVSDGPTIVSGGTLYVFAYNSPTITGVPTDGRPPYYVNMADDAFLVEGVDDRFVYWITRKAELWRTAK